MHIVKHHINDHDCENCSAHHETLEEFNNHLENCLEESANYSCKFCSNEDGIPYIWHSAKTYQFHIADYHKLYRVVCADPTCMCGTIAQTEGILSSLHKSRQKKLEQKKSNENRIFVCDKCGESFKKGLYLTCHRKYKHGEDVHQEKYTPTGSLKRLFRCTYCNKTFGGKYQVDLFCRKVQTNAKTKSLGTPQNTLGYTI